MRCARKRAATVEEYTPRGYRWSGYGREERSRRSRARPRRDARHDAAHDHGEHDIARDARRRSRGSRCARPLRPRRARPGGVPAQVLAHARPHHPHPRVLARASRRSSASTVRDSRAASSSRPCSASRSSSTAGSSSSAAPSMSCARSSPGMMTLISLAIVVAFGYSLAVTFGLPGMDFWWELATLILIMLLGHWIEMSAVMGAQDALGELAKLLPGQGGAGVADPHARTEAVAVADAARRRPRAGASRCRRARRRRDRRRPQRSSTSRCSPASPSPSPARRASRSSPAASPAAARSSCGSASTGGDTALAGIMRLVSDAQASKSGTQVLADRAAAWLFYVALAVASRHPGRRGSSCGPATPPSSSSAS